MRLLALLLMLAAIGCGGRPHVDSIEWTVMGTVAKVSFKGCAPDVALKRRVCAAVREVYGDVESRLSIWNPHSEISNYTSIDGVSAETRPCYEAAFAMRERSGGAFDPFWRGDAKGPDLGAIAKGFAVDLAARRLLENGLVSDDILLDLGGNLKAVSGTWNTGILDPSGSGGVVRGIVLTNGMACATSGEYARGKHIYDGRTGKPVSNRVASVTVVHPSSAMLADALSTTLFVLGQDEGSAFLRKFHPEAYAEWVLR